MAVTAFPYDSQVTDGLEGDEYDRAIDSSIFRKLFLKYFTEGVSANPSNSFQVMANSSMGAIVKVGFAMIQGVTAYTEDDETITFSVAESQDRIDRVVLRHDDTLSVRNTSIVVIKGTPSSNPSAPAHTRNQTTYDLVLADVRIRAGATSVSQADITDRRLDNSVCGIITGTVQQVDTTTLYEQIQDDLAGFKDEEQAEFSEWFETIKGKLGTDAAGNLQNQIDDINENMPKIFYGTSDPDTTISNQMKNGDIYIKYTE